MKEIFSFLDRLAANNNREWFAANKTEYDRLRVMWTEKLQELLDEMSLYDRSLSHVNAKDCLYRIYRDTRFSNDKTPYKTHFAALLSPTGRHCDRACYYIHLGADECAIYSGVWCPEPRVLKKLRKAIIDNIEEFRGIVETPEIMETFPIWWGRKLKTAPKGYERDHPDIEYLRLTEYGKCCQLDREFFERPDWIAETARRLALLKPMNDFLNYSIDE